RLRDAPLRSREARAEPRRGRGDPLPRGVGATRYQAGEPEDDHLPRPEEDLPGARGARRRRAMSGELRYMPCVEFEESIHGYVDGALEQADAKNLLVHIELCDPCRTSVESVRRQIRLHRDAIDPARLAAAFDREATFRKLTGSLLAGNVGRLSELL